MRKLLFLLIVCIGFSGCLSTKKYHVAENDIKQTKEQNGITVICEYLDEGDLIKRHGREDNPYIDKEWALTPVYSLAHTSFPVRSYSRTKLAPEQHTRYVPAAVLRTMR